MGLFSKATTALFVLYVAYSIRNIASLIDLRPVAEDELKIPHAVQVTGTPYDLLLYLSVDSSAPEIQSFSSDIPPRHFPSIPGFTLVAACSASYGYNPNTSLFRLLLGLGDLTRDFDTVRDCFTLSNGALVPTDSQLRFVIPEELVEKVNEENHLWLTTVAIKVRKSSAEHVRMLFPPSVLQLTNRMPIEKLQRPLRYLLKDPSGARQLEQLSRLAVIYATIEGEETSALAKANFVAYPPKIIIGPVIHRKPQGGLPVSKLRSRGLWRSVFKNEDESYVWCLPMAANTFASPRDEYLPLHGGRKLVEVATQEPVSEVPEVKVQFRPISLGAWILQGFVAYRLDNIEHTLGVGSYDVDSLKLVLGGGNPALVTCTGLISTLHLFFGLLALAADINYWRNAENVKSHGVSRSSLELEGILEFFIVLNLWWEGQSLFVLLFPLAHLSMLRWKWQKIRGQSKADKTLEELEAYEKKWLWRLAIPMVSCCLIVCFYQLFFVPQAGWDGWIVKSLALCAYGAGFASMTPQLFRNHKLQSVENLPWAALIYQALNAFVDDFFAMIIRMPQMHRVSVFRDDIIFIVYAIQRWKYQKKAKVE